MSKECYIEQSFGQDALQLIAHCQAVVKDYVKQGFMLTVRQIYYQIVATDLFPEDRRYWFNADKQKWVRDPQGLHDDSTKNAPPNYKWLCNVVNDARMAGLLDWSAIEDRTREYIRRTHWESPQELLNAVAKQYYEDTWSDQANRVLVIVEKEALAGVLQPICHELDVPLLAARGYPSGTVLREFVQSDILPAIDNNQECHIIHLGDHDPSGIDMTRDLENRISTFAHQPISMNRVALTMQQIRTQKPPENPAKTTDSRFESYMAEYGTASWELDALKPNYLAALVRKHVTALLDEDKRQARIDEIEEKRERLRQVAEEWDD